MCLHDSARSRSAQLRSLLAAFVLAAAAVCGFAPRAAAAQSAPDFVELVEKVAPAVVNIRTTERIDPGARSPFRRRAPSGQEDEAPRGEGSGFLISADGYVVTNAHVVDGASDVLVTLPDKREFKAKIVGSDVRTDLALVKIEASGLPSVRIGDVSRLRVGEWVLAIGSPFGLDSTVTAGIVSAKHRETGSDIAFLQTDVAVNPGNSGGPLINTRGEVVGVNSQILSPIGSYIGISFAIPIDEAMRVVDQLKSGGRVVRGYLGIQPTDVPRELAEEYGLATGKSKSRGAFVRLVVPGAPGEKAGIQPGDVIVSVDGRPVDSAADLRRTLGAMKPGSTVNLQINRRGKSMDFKVVLSESDPQTAQAEPPLAAPDQRASSAAKTWGLTVANLSDAERRALRGAAGVKVAAVSGGAEAVGMRAGDVILAVGTTDVSDLKQFDAVIAKVDKARPLPVTVLRGDWAQFLRIPIVK
ncbi:MAG TPA: Do family serine endopeptidase [Burkholderiaceae bacterium]|jgi:serine protease Do|nr:Do family serine endopeptidase [Burkholderiaceae bacterium]